MEKGNEYNLVVGDEDDCLRLDQYLAQALTVQSRSYLQKIIKQGQVLVNGKAPKVSTKMKSRDKVVVILPKPIPMDVAPESIPLDILYDDDDLLVVNKSPGMVVHPAAGNYQHTLVNALLFYCDGKLSGIGGVLRPGIVHRLDKDTSGCLVVAKNDTTHRSLSVQFHDRQIKKEYLAIVSGWVRESEGVLNGNIGRHPIHRKKMAVRLGNGKEAVTSYNVIERFEKASFLSLKPGTGRTHQLRVHMADLGYPILGDKEYSSRRRRVQLPGVVIGRQMLHAYKIAFLHPATEKLVEFEAPLPEDMQSLLDYLRKSNLAEGVQ